MSESTVSENAKRDLEQEKLDNMMMYISIGLFVWLFLVSAPLILIFEPDSAWVRAGIMLAYIPLCRWLYFSKSGPGVEGVNKVFFAVVSAISAAVTAVPERIRFWLMAPLFVASALAMTAQIGHLAFSDEVSQKRALFSSYESSRDIKWFHSGDKIDIYVFSQYMDRKFKAQAGEVGVHLTYQSDSAMSKTGYDFRRMLEADLSTAEFGKTSTTAEAEIAVYEANRNPLAGVSYHGVFGLTGIGAIEMALFMMLLFATLVLLYADKKYRHSGMLALTTAMFVIFIFAGGMGGGIEEDRPVKIDELGPAQSPTASSTQLHKLTGLFT